MRRSDTEWRPPERSRQPSAWGKSTGHAGCSDARRARGLGRASRVGVPPLLLRVALGGAGVSRAGAPPLLLRVALGGAGAGVRKHNGRTARTLPTSAYVEGS